MPLSKVVLIRDGKKYIGGIREESIDKSWYKGELAKDEVRIDVDNIVNLIHMTGTDSKEICRVGLTGLKACLKSDEDGLYLCRYGWKEWKRCKSFVISFYRKRNGKLISYINSVEEV